MKRYRASCEPKPLTSNWLKDDVRDTWCRPHSYAKAYHCWLVVAKGGFIVAEFKNEKTARSFAECRGYKVKEFALTEEAAHKQRLIDMEKARWEAGWGA